MHCYENTIWFLNLPMKVTHYINLSDVSLNHITSKSNERLCRIFVEKLSEIPFPSFLWLLFVFCGCKLHVINFFRVLLCVFRKFSKPRWFAKYWFNKKTWKWNIWVKEIKFSKPSFAFGNWNPFFGSKCTW